MSLLTTLAIVFVALLALVVLGLWLLRALARGWIARRLAAQAAAPGQGIAARITLVPTERPWRQPGTEALVEALRAAGFVEIDRYDVPEMHVMRLWGGAHPEDGIAAAVYDHGSVPPFYDLVRVYADYGTSTITTNPVHDPANLPPLEVQEQLARLTGRDLSDPDGMSAEERFSRESEFLDEVLLGWDGITDDEGVPVPCTEESRAAVLDIIEVRRAVFDAFFASALGKKADAKN